MNKIPLTVLLPVYNAGPYLEQAVASILNQSFGSFELLIINDGSTDGSQQLINKFTDKRVVSIEHTKNLGLIATLNEGLSLARGRFIARMDQDDLSHPLRLEKQLRYLISSQAGLVGTLAAAVDRTGTFIDVVPFPIYSKDIQFGLQSKNCFCHGSVMIDTAKIPPHLLSYPSNLNHTEDYAFWLKLSNNGIKMRNLPEILYYWRSHSMSISKIAQTEQQDSYSTLFLEQMPVRNQFGLADIVNFFTSGFLLVPRWVMLNNYLVSSNLPRDYQYNLFVWLKSTWKNKPLHALLALVLVIILSPQTIIKKVIPVLDHA